MRIPKMKSALAAAVIAVAGGALAAAQPAGAQLVAAPDAAQSGSVQIGDNTFTPKTLTVDAGATVTWTHAGQRPHSVTADDGSFDSSPNCPDDCLQNGSTFSRTFNRAGTFGYFCKLHGAAGGIGMSGTIVVREAAGEQPTPTPTPAPVREVQEEPAQPAYAQPQPAAQPAYSQPQAAKPAKPAYQAPAELVAGSSHGYGSGSTQEPEPVEAPWTDFPSVAEQPAEAPAQPEQDGSLAATPASGSSSAANLALYLVGVLGLGAAFGGLLLAARRG